ncbi:MAG: hypothetical protein ACOYMF_00655 [Bacteroidales bacterium]
MKPLNRTVWIILFALAMGFLEAAVVVYIRALYYPEGFAFPLREMAPYLATTELLRELATLIMILAIGILAAKEKLHRFAWFLIVFAIWDIAYYLFLKLLIGWPSSLLTTDILFMLPSLWTGPVVAPIINSLTMILLATLILISRPESFLVTRLSRVEWVLLITGSVLVLISYMKDFVVFALDYLQSLPRGEDFSLNQVMIILPSHFVPHSFDWLLFCIGVFLHQLAIVLIFNRKQISIK